MAIGGKLYLDAQHVDLLKDVKEDIQERALLQEPPQARRRCKFFDGAAGGKSVEEQETKNMRRQSWIGGQLSALRADGCSRRDMLRDVVPAAKRTAEKGASKKTEAALKKKVSVSH